MKYKEVTQMGKKKKKNSNYFGYTTYKSDKKKKKKNKDKDRDIGFKANRASIDRKEAKTARKIVLAPVKVPDAFADVRKSCNHAGKSMSVAEYKAMTPSYTAYTPMLDRALAQYGEDSLSVCAGCFDVIPKYDLIAAEEVLDAMTVLYLAANKVLMLKRLNGDEIKEITKLRESLKGWREIAEEIRGLDELIKAYGVSDGKISGKKRETNLNSAGDTFVM